MVIFGDLKAGSSSAEPMAIRVTNSRSASARLDPVIAGSGFSFADSGCQELAAGAPCPIMVRFTPAQVESYQATVTINFSPSGRYAVTDLLTGRGT
jgi:hypothetical protein